MTTYGDGVTGAGPDGGCCTADTLSPMCGIVGYVGEQSALEVVIEGLRRLEYRGYDSAGVALISDGKLVTEKRAGKLANLEAALAENPLGAGDHRHRAHPVGHPRRAQRPQRPPARRLHRARSRSSTTASSRTSPTCAPSSRRAATS